MESNPKRRNPGTIFPVVIPAILLNKTPRICYKYRRRGLRYESSVHERLMKTCRWSMFPESLGWLTGQPNDPPPPMYDPFAGLIADYLPGSDIDRGRVWKGSIASGMQAVCVLPSSVYLLFSSFTSSPPLLRLPFLVHCRDTHRESSYTRRRGI